jgi:hypothetical protein
MATKKKGLFCKQPDRDVPGIVCGHPLPCPYHTAVIDMTGDKPVVDIPQQAEAAAQHAGKLSDIAQALDRSADTLLPNDAVYTYAYTDDGAAVVIEKNGTPCVVMGADVFQWFRSLPKTNKGEKCAWCGRVKTVHGFSVHPRACEHCGEPPDDLKPRVKRRTP